MSTIPTRLRWEAGHGFLQHDGVHVDLQAAPFGWSEADYAPGCCAIVRPGPADQMRDMTAEEAGRCMALLHAVAIAARTEVACRI